MAKYTISNVQTRDEWGPVHGSMMQDYAIALEGMSEWIKLTQKVDTKPPQIGDVLEGYIEEKTTRNGKPYKKFKKENPAYSDGGRSESQHSPSQSQTDYIVQMLEELTGRRDAAEQDSSGPTEDELDDPFKDL